MDFPALAAKILDTITQTRVVILGLILIICFSWPYLIPENSAGVNALLGSVSALPIFLAIYAFELFFLPAIEKKRNEKSDKEFEDFVFSEEIKPHVRTLLASNKHYNYMNIRPSNPYSNRIPRESISSVPQEVIHELAKREIVQASKCDLVFKRDAFDRLRILFFKEIQ